MTVATAEDVSERLGRPLNPDEVLTVDALLVDAESEIQSKGGGSRITDPLWRAQVIKVECEMVLRAAQLSAKTTNIVPQVEDIDRLSDTGTFGFRPRVHFTRPDRRSLGLKLNGIVNLSPTPTYPLYWWDIP